MDFAPVSVYFGSGEFLVTTAIVVSFFEKLVLATRLGFGGGKRGQLDALVSAALLVLRMRFDGQHEMSP